MKGFDINVSAKVLYFSFIVLILWLNIVEISSVLHLSFSYVLCMFKVNIS